MTVISTQIIEVKKQFSIFLVGNFIQMRRRFILTVGKPEKNVTSVYKKMPVCDLLESYYNQVQSSEMQGRQIVATSCCLNHTILFKKYYKGRGSEMEKGLNRH